MGQFSSMRIFDGTSISAPRIDLLDRFSTTTAREYIASNTDGAITVSFSANSSTASGWLAGITCEKPLQFMTVQNGLFTDAATWLSKLPGSLNYSPASRRPFKGDDSIIIKHVVTVAANTSLPLDQTIIEAGGSLTVPSNSSLTLYNDNEDYELSVKGIFNLNGNVFGTSGFSPGGKIALEGTLNLQGQINIDSVVITPNASPANIITSGNAQIFNLMLNSPGGLNINGSLDVSRGLVLQQGIINVASPNFIRLVSGNGPVLQGGSANSYVNGKLRWQTFITSDPLIFPVGKDGVFRKIEIQPDQNSFDFNVEYEAELFTGVPPARTLPGTFSNINQLWYHTVKITDGASRFNEATATIYYQASDGVTDPSALRIGKGDGSADWADIGGTGTAAVEGSITSQPFFTFSDFVLANLSGGPLPVTLLNFNGNLMNNTAQLSWKADNEDQLSGYEVQRSTNGAAFSYVVS